MTLATPRPAGPTRSAAPVRSAAHTPSAFQNQEHLRLLLENSLDVLVEVNSEGRINYVSANVERVLGYAPAELAGTNVFDRVHPEDLAQILEYFELTEGCATCRYQHKNGAWKWLESTGRDFRLPNGDTRTVLIVRDISERKRSEQALAESEEKFSKAFRSSPGAMGITERNSRHFIEVNAGYSKVFGYSRQEFIGRTALEMGLWAREEERECFLNLVAKQGRVQDMEFTGRTKAGELVNCLLSAETFELGGRKSLVTSLCDVTAIRKAESEKASLEAQLRQAQKLEAIGTLAGGIAHDFNNILAAIVAYTEMARMDSYDPELVRNHLGHVSAASNRAKELVKQILAFGRQQKQERKPLKAQLVIGEALKLLRSTIPATIEIKSNIERESPLVLADPTQVHQVVMNLCTNAAHAMRETPGTLTVVLAPQEVDDTMASLCPGLRPGHYVRLTVSDTGHGMDSSTLKRMYEPFFTTKGPGEGSGLGLPVVHGIIKEHEGAIVVQSEPGKGTTFQIYFPALQTQTAETETPQTAPPRGNGELVLFVDDEPAICLSAQSVLERLGYRVVAQTDPAVALDYFRKMPEAFDLIIVDLAMPHTTGMEVAGAILQLRPDMPVLLASGYNGTWTPERVKAIGITDLILKPMNMAELGQAVKRALTKQSRN